ncbi:MAG: nuclear transport factor 2 family protein [Acidimicrobiales bacterium]|nr:nuclear transport factor 2 family protein [Acidimicrobiales bacterium]
MVGEANVDVVVEFNRCINDGDLDGLRRLMAPDHRFVDSAGGVVEGVEACVAAWRGFFRSFPGYRNVFTAVEAVSSTEVVAQGRSECTVAALDGPARWRAVVRGGLVAEWRVDEAVSPD